MNQGEWRLFRMRPANHPRRQLVGAAAILDRSLKQGLALGLGEITQGLSPAKLTGALCVPGLAGPAFVGPERARYLAVNAVLPLMCYAWGGSRWWRARWSDYALPPVPPFDGQLTIPGDGSATASR